MVNKIWDKFVRHPEKQGKYFMATCKRCQHTMTGRPDRMIEHRTKQSCKGLKERRPFTDTESDEVLLQKSSLGAMIDASSVLQVGNKRQQPKHTLFPAEPIGNVESEASSSGKIIGMKTSCGTRFIRDVGKRTTVWREYKTGTSDVFATFTEKEFDPSEGTLLMHDKVRNILVKGEEEGSEGMCTSWKLDDGEQWNLLYQVTWVRERL